MIDNADEFESVALIRFPEKVQVGANLAATYLAAEREKKLI